MRKLVKAVRCLLRGGDQEIIELLRRELKLLKRYLALKQWRNK